MSGWSRTVKPHADTTKDPAKIFGVDDAEMAVTPGPAHAGWVYRKTIGSRVVYETLVSMKNPPVEDNADDTVFPDTKITITSSGTNKTVTAGAAVATLFKVVVTSNPPVSLLYQWQQSVDGGVTFNNINSGGGVFTGVNTDTLGVNAGMTDTSSTYNGAKFRCVVGAINTGATEISTPKTLTVNP